MSHVFFAAGGTIDAERDAVGGLRDTLEYVTTPLVKRVDGSSPSDKFQPCGIVGCDMVWRFDWVVDPPFTYRVDPTAVQLLSFYGRLVPQADGTNVVLGRPVDRVLDVTPALSPPVVDLVHAANVAFLTPVEEGTAGRRGAVGVPFSVAIASPWRQASRRPLALASVGGRLQVVGEHHVNGPTTLGRPASTLAPGAALFGPVDFVPSDRDGSRAVFSGTEQAVYMVGGHLSTSQPTGEVWRFDIAAKSWRHLFLGESPGTLPGDLRAIAYDEVARRIVFVDDGLPAPATTRRKPRHQDHDDDLREGDGREDGGAPEHEGDGKPRSRIVLGDLGTHKMTTLATVPKTDALTRVALVHRGGGEYFLVRCS